LETAERELATGIQGLRSVIAMDKNGNGLKARWENLERSLPAWESTLADIRKALQQPTAVSMGAGGGPSGAATKDEDKEKRAGMEQKFFSMENPNVPWEKVAGLEAAKEALIDAIITPIRFPELFEGERKPVRGVLMYGPPGTGKSHLAKAVATQMISAMNEANPGGAATKGTFISVQASDIMSKWQGEAVKNIKSMFSIAKENKPAVVRPSPPPPPTHTHWGCPLTPPPTHSPDFHRRV